MQSQVQGEMFTICSYLNGGVKGVKTAVNGIDNKLTIVYNKSTWEAKLSSIYKSVAVRVAFLRTFRECAAGVST